MKEIKQAFKKATQGKWVHANAGWQDGGIQLEDGTDVISANGDSYATVGISDEDAKLICLLKNNAESLISKVEEMQKTLEWAARIIDSGMGAGILRYDPLQWFIDYHTSLKGVIK